MKPQPTAALWMVSSFCPALALAAIVLADLGADERGIHWALRATARLSFLLFWAAYSGSALASLFGPTFLPLKQRAREFGLAFASALLVHLGAPGISVFILFGIATLWVYFLALFSIRRLQLAVGPKYWWLLRNVGMNYIACMCQAAISSISIFTFRHSCCRRPGFESRRIGPAPWK